MKKKTLSLALALVMCLGLTVPAFSAKVGDTTIEDSAGYRYTLSQPVEGVSETTVSDAQGKLTAPVYQIPAGTVITPVCPEGNKGEDAGGIFYALTDEEGLRQAGDAVQNSDSSQAISFIVDYKIMTKNNEGVTIIGDLEGEIDDLGNPMQPLPEGQYLIGRNISWAYSFIGNGVSGSSTTSVGKSSYLCVEVVPKSENATEPKPTTPTDPAVTVEDIPASGTAIASTQTVTVDGKAVEFQMYALKDANGNLTNYIKLRDMAYVLNGTKAQFAVGYDGTISLTTGQPYQAGGTEMTTPYSGDRAYTGGAQTVKIDGKDVAMTAITLTDDNGGGYNYFKLRDLGKALGFNVGYSNENGVFIESDKPYAG